MVGSGAKTLLSNEEANALVAKAAKGSVKAQRALRDHAWLLAATGHPSLFEQAFAMAEVFARMVAARGTAADRRMLGGILLKRSELLSPSLALMQDSALEAVDWIERAAEQGDALAIEQLPGLHTALEVEGYRAPPLVAYHLAGHA